MKSVNLGENADTTGAVTGQISGAFYGVQAIPHHWLDKLLMKEKITEFAEQLFEHRQAKISRK